MSDNWLLVIPTDPAWLPANVTATAALDVFRTLVSVHHAVRNVRTEMHGEVEFIDPGENWHEVRCPTCSAALETRWWRGRIGEAYATRFTQLGVIAPCCGTRTSLNDLGYDWPAGFARFVLSATNPDRG